MRYLFDDYVLDPDRRELRRAGDRIELEPQVFDLLEFLIRTRDRVASRDDLLEAVWQGRIVSESTLSSRINAARTAIGDNGTTQRLIRTLLRKGVRFVGDVREEQEQEPKAEREPVSLQAAFEDSVVKVPSIAVLPFANMSGEQEDEYFADGMAEEIITGLAQCSGLTVVARNSSFAFRGRSVDVRQIGNELGASYVLEGSVRRSDKRLRITAQLIDARSGGHLWADRFDEDLSDVFELQDRITESVVAVIEPKLLFTEAGRARRQPPQNLDAYDLYLRALSLINEYTAEATAEALHCLDKALEFDPNYAQAMAASACYRALSQFQGWTGQSAEPEVQGRAAGVGRDRSCSERSPRAVDGSVCSLGLGQRRAPLAGPFSARAEHQSKLRNRDDAGGLGRSRERKSRGRPGVDREVRASQPHTSHSLGRSGRDGVHIYRRRQTRRGGSVGRTGGGPKSPLRFCAPQPRGCAGQNWRDGQSTTDRERDTEGRTGCNCRRHTRTDAVCQRTGVADLH